MNETTVKLALDTRSSSKKKDNTYPIKIRVRHKGKNDLVGIGHDLAVTWENWNDNKKEVRSSVENSGRVRAKCKDKLKIAQDVVDNNHHLLHNLSLEQLVGLVRDALKNPVTAVKSFDSVITVEKKLSKGLTLKEWGEILIQRRNKAKDFGTADWYDDGMNALLNFYGNDQLLLKEINKTLLEDWKAEYIAQGLKIGGLNTRLRALRAMLNYAVDEEKLDPDLNPFNKNNPRKRKFKIPSAKTEKRAVSSDIIADIIKLYQNGSITVKNHDVIDIIKVKEGSSDWHCICECIFMWETLAMNFIDLVKLKVQDVMEDIIEYERSKTGMAMKTMNSDLSKEIAAYYAEGKTSNDFLFRYGWDDTRLGYERFKQHRKRFNQRMKKLVKRMGHGEVEFSTYVIRHTLATTLNENGVDRDDIGKMYGHSDGRSIDTYIDKQNVVTLVSKARNALAKVNLNLSAQK